MVASTCHTPSTHTHPLTFPTSTHLSSLSHPSPSTHSHIHTLTHTPHLPYYHSSVISLPSLTLHTLTHSHTHTHPSPSLLPLICHLSPIPHPPHTHTSHTHTPHSTITIRDMVVRCVAPDGERYAWKHQVRLEEHLLCVSPGSLGH